MYTLYGRCWSTWRVKCAISRTRELHASKCNWEYITTSRCSKAIDICIIVSVLECLISINAGRIQLNYLAPQSYQFQCQSYMMVFLMIPTTRDFNYPNLCWSTMGMLRYLSMNVKWCVCLIKGIVFCRVWRILQSRACFGSLQGNVFMSRLECGVCTASFYIYCSNSITGQGHWSSVGVTTYKLNDDNILCSSEHLTSFSVLVAVQESAVGDAFFQC